MFPFLRGCRGQIKRNHTKPFPNAVRGKPRTAFLYISEKEYANESQDHKKVDESTLTTLCAVCRGAFLDAKGARLRRADPRQLVKEVCTYCQTRYGFDYYVQPIVHKSKMTGKENRRETEPA
jgi:hypothetical protein